MGFLSFLGDLASGIINPVAEMATGVASPLVDVVDPLFQKMDSTLNQGNRDFAMQQQEDAQAFNAEQSQLQRDFSAEQNRIAMEFNASEAMKAREWSSEENVLKRQLASGINPLSADSNGFISSPASVNPASGAEAHSSPVVPNSYVNPIDSILKGVDIADKLFDLDMKKKKAPFDLKLAQLIPEDMAESIRLKKKEQDQIQSNMDFTKKRMSEIDENILISQKLRELYDTQGKIEQFKLDHLAEEFENTMNNLKADTALKNMNVKVGWSTVTRNLAEAAKLDADAQNARDVHVLNGVQLRIYSDEDKVDELVTAVWNQETREYDLKTETGKTLKRRAELKNADWGAWYRRWKKAPITTILCLPLDAFDIIAESLGKVLGGSVSYDATPKKNIVKPIK